MIRVRSILLQSYLHNNRLFMVPHLIWARGLQIRRLTNMCISSHMHTRTCTHTYIQTHTKMHTHTCKCTHSHTHAHLGTCADMITSPGNLLGLCCPELVCCIGDCDKYFHTLWNKNKGSASFFSFRLTGLSECSLCFSHAELLEIIIMCTKMFTEVWRQG